MDVKRKPVLRARPDVSDFIGKSGGKARGENRVNFFGERVVTLSDVSPGQIDRCHAIRFFLTTLSVFVRHWTLIRQPGSKR
eukprot:2647065-Rhodomonas_salina.3